jgi:hypothetical protein
MDILRGIKQFRDMWEEMLKRIVSAWVVEMEDGCDWFRDFPTRSF